MDRTKDTTVTEERTATAPDAPHPGGVTLINSFDVAAGRDDAFRALWNEASAYFRAQPGFLSLRLHRAVSPDARYRFVNVARWASHAEFQAAHQVVGQPAWREFPSNPSLYQVVVEHDAPQPSHA